MPKLNRKNCISSDDIWSACLTVTLKVGVLKKIKKRWNSSNVLGIVKKKENTYFSDKLYFSVKQAYLLTS